MPPSDASFCRTIEPALTAIMNTGSEALNQENFGADTGHAFGQPILDLQTAMRNPPMGDLSAETQGVVSAASDFREYLISGNADYDTSLNKWGKVLHSEDPVVKSCSAAGDPLGNS